MHILLVSNLSRKTVSISIADVVTSILAGFVTFQFVGHLAGVMHNTVHDSAEEGMLVYWNLFSLLYYYLYYVYLFFINSAEPIRIGIRFTVYTSEHMRTGPALASFEVFPISHTSYRLWERLNCGLSSTF